MEVEAKAEAVQVAGGRFEVEDVSTTRVRIACVHDSKAIAYKQVRVVDRFITEAVDAIVEKAYEILVQRQ